MLPLFCLRCNPVASYYLPSFASTDLAGSAHSNFMWSVLVEIPGYFFCIFVMDCWGRRPILSFCQVKSIDYYRYIFGKY